MKVVGRRGVNKPGVAESAAQGVRIEVGKGRFQLDSGIKENGEKSISRRRSSLGPRRGPRRRTTTARRHTRGVVWAVSKSGRWWYRFKMRWVVRGQEAMDREALDLLPLASSGGGPTLETVLIAEEIALDKGMCGMAVTVAVTMAAM